MDAGEGEVLLAGGVANQGAVVRVGDTVRRPAGPHSPAVAALLGHLEAVGCTVAPRFLGYDEQGREVLSWVEGDVPLPPFPAWATSEAALRSVARLLRTYHDALAGFVPPPGARWSPELADPAVNGTRADGWCPACHDDVCPENVVFRDGKAVALLDFDFAAPGRRLWDVVSTAAMWVPIEALEWRRAHPPGLDAVARIAAFADAYGLTAEECHDFVAVLEERHAVGRAFVDRRVQAGEPAFVQMATEFGAGERWVATDRWVAAERHNIEDALRRPTPPLAAG
jgi:Phosphotransferase enzyme family